MLHTRKPKQKRCRSPSGRVLRPHAKKKKMRVLPFLHFVFVSTVFLWGKEKKQRHHSCWRIKQLPYLHRFHTEYKRITAASRTCSKCFEKQARNSSLLLRSSATQMHGNGRFEVIKKKRRKYSRATKSREETKNSGRKKTPAHRSRTKKKKRKVTNSIYKKQKLSSNVNNN